MAMYMSFEGAKGDATQTERENWINIIHFDWTIDWPITTRAGVKNDLTRDGNHPQVHEIHIQKYADRATTRLIREICKSNTPRLCRLHFLRTDNTAHTYMEYDFYESLITQWSISTDPAQNPIETVHINFKAFEVCFFPTDEGNNDLPMRTEHYELIEKKK